MPLRCFEFGSLVAKRKPKPGRWAVSPASRIFAPTVMSSTACVESPVAVTKPARGAGCRLVIDRYPRLAPSADGLQPLLNLLERHPIGSAAGRATN